MTIRLVCTSTIAYGSASNSIRRFSGCQGMRILLAGLLFSATIVSCAGGCYLRPNFGPPGTIGMQRSRAVVHDPFPSDDLGPRIVGGRPKGFDRPQAEAENLQEIRGTLFDTSTTFQSSPFQNFPGFQSALGSPTSGVGAASGFQATPGFTASPGFQAAPGFQSGSNFQTGPAFQPGTSVPGAPAIPTLTVPTPSFNVPTQGIEQNFSGPFPTSTNPRFGPFN